MRKIIVWVWLVAIAGESAHAAGTVLIDHGQAKCSIVVPGACGPTVRRAASELAGYLKTISGAGVPIVKADAFKGGARIELRVDASLADSIGKGSGSPREALSVVTDAEGVVIAGASERAVLFGVYRFLEEVLGCRWLTSDGHEVVPKRPRVAVGEVAIRTAPAFDLRTFTSRGDSDAMAWGLKMGLNGFYTDKAAKSNGGCYYLPEKLPGCHTWSRVIPSKRYYDEHPEWFPLLNGRRMPIKGHGGQLCVTARGLADEFAKNIVALFDRDPSLKVTSISPNDGYGWCQCEACLALDEKLCGGRTTKQGLGKARPFRGDRVFWFANEVAERVAEKHPDKLLLVLAYVNYAEPPDTIRPRENVVPWLCHYAPADYAKPIADPTSEPNKQFNRLLRPWAKIAPHLLFYGYVSKSMWWRLPRPVTRTFAADVKYLHSLGVHRYYCQSSLSDWELDGPLYYVIAKLLWDPSGDPEALAKDWIDHMFGPAGLHMSAFYKRVEASVRKTGEPYSDNPPRDVPGLYAMAELERARDALADAAQEVPKAPYAERVSKVADTFLYGFHMVRAIEAMEDFKATADPASLTRASELSKKALRYSRGSGKAQRFVESIKSLPDLGVIGKGFGKPQELGGRRCWNSDETGPGDGRSGWATFYVPTASTDRPVVVEMDVWGTSRLRGIVINTREGEWNAVMPQSKLSGKEGWETLVYTISPKLLAKDRRIQTIGFGGGDSQVWIAEIRVRGLGGE